LWPNSGTEVSASSLPTIDQQNRGKPDGGASRGARRNQKGWDKHRERAHDEAQFYDKQTQRLVLAHRVGHGKGSDNTPDQASHGSNPEFDTYGGRWTLVRFHLSSLTANIDADQIIRPWSCQLGRARTAKLEA
jgi:hypothetical protein